METFEHAIENLDLSYAEVALDCKPVRRLDGNDIRALENLAVKADEKSVKVVLRGVNVEVYKVLKLVKLAGRFTLAA
jgi:anti-anti-sigma regulatory factor